MSRLQIVVNNNETACRPLKYQEKIRKTAKITSGEQARNKRVRLIQGERLHFSARLMRQREVHPFAETRKQDWFWFSSF
jgi:hypothetical protein